MEFVRKGRGRFHGGGFTIVRPSGRSMSRAALELIHPDHDYNFRLDETQIWLLDDEREIGYARGNALKWDLLVGERSFSIEQRKYGTNHSVVLEDDEIATEVGGGGFPLKVVEINRDAGLTEEQQAFVVAIALLGWREADRSMMSAAGTGGGVDGV